MAFHATYHYVRDSLMKTPFFDKIIQSEGESTRLSNTIEKLATPNFAPIPFKSTQRHAASHFKEV